MTDNQHEPHDAAFERALTSGLKRQPEPETDCPDAETLGAFWDQSLAPDERRLWEVHCAACSRCQARFAALAHTAAVEEELAEEQTSRRFGWLFDWRWLVPMTTAAIVLLAVWGIAPEPLTEPQMPMVGDADFAATTESVQESAESSQAAPLERPDATRAERESVAAEADGLLAQDEASALDQVVPAEPSDLDTLRDAVRNRATPARGNRGAR